MLAVVLSKYIITYPNLKNLAKTGLIDTSQTIVEYWLYLLFKWATLVAKVPEFPCLSLLHCFNIIMLLEVHCINMNTLRREVNILNFLQKVNSLEIKINWEYLNLNEYEKRKKIPDMKGTVHWEDIEKGGMQQLRNIPKRNSKTDNLSSRSQMDKVLPGCLLLLETWDVDEHYFGFYLSFSLWNGGWGDNCGW